MAKNKFCVTQLDFAPIFRDLEKQEIQKAMVYLTQNYESTLSDHSAIHLDIAVKGRLCYMLVLFLSDLIMLFALFLSSCVWKIFFLNLITCKTAKALVFFIYFA